MSEEAEERLGHIIQCEFLSKRIEQLIDQRNEIQKLINILDEERIRLEKPHLKGENIDE